MIAHEGTQFACFLQFNGICSLEGDGLACGFSHTVFGISPNPIGGVKLQVAESYLLGSDGMPLPEFVFYVQSKTTKDAKHLDLTSFDFLPSNDG